MGRLLGTIFILCGSAGCLFSWWENERKKQKFMEECVRLFALWSYAVEKEHMRLYDFLENYETKWDEMKELLLDLKQMLSENRYASGNEAWQEVLFLHKKQLPLKGESYRILEMAADTFFGNSSMESLRCAGICRKRMEEELSAYRKEYVAKQKVYMPLGMMGGLVLVIFLL